MKLIGITGLIGSGKTTVGHILKDLGYVVCDMDVWCRKLYQNPAFLKIIKKNFPLCFEGDVFHKKVLRNIVFSDHRQLELLENIIHPYLKNELLSFIHTHRFNPYIIFVEIALLYQMNLERFFSDIIRTDAPYDVMLQRTMKRDCIDKKQYDSIIKKQKNGMYQKVSDLIINTNQPLTQLKKDVIKILKRIEEC